MAGVTSNAVEWAIESLESARKRSDESLRSIPEDKYCFQPVAGANHALWILGHLPTVDEYFLKTVGGRPSEWYDKYKEVFFMRSQPQPNIADYPSIASVREQYHRSRATLIEWARSLDEATLFAPLEGRLKDFCPNRLALLARLNWHEGMHTGQLTVIRKSLGMPPLFG